MSPDLPRQEGSETSLAALLGTHEQRVRRLLLNRSGDPNAVDDLWQQTALDMVVQWDRGPLEADHAVRLLYTIAKRRAADHHRDRGRGPQLISLDRILTDDADDDKPCFDAPDPLMQRDYDAVLDGIELARLRRYLTPDQQRVLELLYLDELDYKTTAQLMGVSVPGVKYHRANAKVRLAPLAQAVFGINTGKVSKEDTR